MNREVNGAITDSAGGMTFELRDDGLLIDGTKFVLQNLSFRERLGEGANAIVLLAENKLLKRREAIKIWKTRKSRNTVDQFLNEVRKNAGVQFPNIAQFYDANVQEGIYYARIEYIHGIVLREFMKHSPEFIIRYTILNKILNTMILVYEAGYYHGDLHHGNVIIRDAEPIIIDFGTSFYTSKIKSHKRDCSMLIELSFEILPELNKLKFLNREAIIKQPSLTVAELLLRSIEICYKLETSDNVELDGYSYRYEEMKLKIIYMENPFLDENLVKNFVKEHYRVKSN